MSVIAVLLSTNDLDINQKLKECNTVNILLDLFFKYSLNNFLHAQVEECIRLVFAWNNALISNPDEEIEPTSPTGVRLKTPPTVEMIEHEEEEGAAATAAEETKEEKSETETKTETPQENVETDQKVEVKEESDEAPSKPASVAINTYENPLLADVSIKLSISQKSEKFVKLQFKLNFPVVYKLSDSRSSPRSLGRKRK